VHRQLIILLSVRYALLAAYPYRYQAIEGDLLFYSVDDIDRMRRAALYVDRILRREGGQSPCAGASQVDLVLKIQSIAIVRAIKPQNRIELR
jgi:hypothetical protein